MNSFDIVWMSIVTLGKDRIVLLVALVSSHRTLFRTRLGRVERKVAVVGISCVVDVCERR